MTTLLLRNPSNQMSIRRDTWLKLVAHARAQGWNGMSGPPGAGSRLTQAEAAKLADAMVTAALDPNLKHIAARLVGFLGEGACVIE